MDSAVKTRSGENGSVLVVALMILVLLTVMGISATKTSEIEIQIAGNEQFHKVAFYNADSGIYTTPKVISQCLDSGTDSTITNITYLGTSGTFFREIMGYNGYDADRDLRFSLGGFDIDVDVDRAGVQNIAGGGVEFASGAEGVGVGSAGGVAILYDMDSLGNGPSAAQSNVTAVYRKVVGVPGGL